VDPPLTVPPSNPSWGDGVEAVLLDFYGTLGESAWSASWLDEILAERGYTVDDLQARRYATEAWDGEEHDEQSRSRDHYLAWLKSLWLQILHTAEVPPVEHPEILDAIEARRRSWRMEAYPETAGVLRELRAMGLRLIVCSNWDWDLDPQLELAGIAGLIDGRVSSAWVGARKPHPRVFRAALDEARVAADAAVMVGDSWVADVEGARAVGIRAVHVWRHAHALSDPAEDVVRVPDLRPLPALLGEELRQPAEER
jgi:putative hydrolase of the HAD superfamily